MKIAIKSPSLGTVFAVLSDENPRTAKAIYNLLPISGTASLWGEEVYFPITLNNPSPLMARSRSEEQYGGEGKGEGEVVKKEGFQLAIAPEHPRTVVKAGEIAVWIEQPSFCIIFGKTPMSTDKEIKVYSECNVIGKVEGSPKIFKKVKEGEKITVSKAPESKIDGEGFVGWLSTSG